MFSVFCVTVNSTIMNDQIFMEDSKVIPLRITCNTILPELIF